MNRALEYIFQNVPKDYFKISMKDFEAIEESLVAVNGESFQELRHIDSPLSVVINCRTNQVVMFKYGRYHVPL